MKIHSKDLIQRFTLPIWNQKKLELIDTYLASDALVNTPFLCGTGPQILKDSYVSTFYGLTDISIETADLITTEDRVIYTWHCRASHTQTLFGFKPTQAPVSFQGITVIQLHHGLITEFTSYSDLLRVMIKLPKRLNSESLMSDIIRTIREITGVKMTKREIECLELWLKGFSIKQTARTLGGLSTRTIQTFRENIKRKLNVSSYQKLLALMHEMGLLTTLLQF